MHFFIYLIIGIIASIQDLKYRKVSDLVHIVIVIISLQNIDFNKLIACIIAFSLFVIPNIIKDNSIGGADVKFMASSGLILGTEKILMATISGMILAILITKTIDKLSKERTISIPLIPYLFIGCLISLI